MFAWAVNKLLAPAQYQKIWGYFHGIEIGATLPYVMGSLRMIICIAMAAGLWRKITCALGFVMHAVTVAVILPSLLMPFIIENDFPTNRNQSITLTAFASFAALWLLWHRGHLSLDAWRAQKRT